MLRELRTSRIGIIGTGLIGASIGLRARALGDVVVGWDADPGRLRDALALGALDGAAQDADAAGDGADILVLATPLEGILAAVKRFAASPPRAELIVDVASLKAPVAEASRALAGFVPTHPIAGSERSGPAAARPDLFVGGAWTYDPDRPAVAVARARAFIERMGALPVPVPSRLHDEIAAFTSHLPQVLAVALAQRLEAALDSDLVRALCGGGMRSMTRLGSSSWEMWASILGANGPAIAQEVRALAAILSEVADDLETDRGTSLQSRFAAAASAAERLRVSAASQNDASSGTVKGAD